MPKNLLRIHDALIAAGIQHQGVGEEADGTLVFANVAPAQLAAANTVITGMDLSETAEADYKADLEPMFKDLKAQANAAIATNDAFLAIVSPNNSQAIAQTKVLTQQNNKIIRVLIRMLAKVNQ